MAAVAKRDGDPTLHVAAAVGWLEIVRRLVGAGADAAKPDKQGQTALEIAQEKKHFVVAEVLGGVAIADLPQETKDEALYEAAKDGKLPDVERLLTEGASPDAKKRGWPALINAAQQGHLDVVGALVRAGAKLEATGSTFGFTALIYATYWGKLLRCLPAQNAH